MRRYAAILSVLACLPAGPALAQPPSSGRTMTVTVYGNDPCPDAGASNEIVVCARRPENDRYRIPKELRRTIERPSETAWGARVGAMEDASRPTMPGSCSAVGTYGQTGCRQQMIGQWYAERRARSR
ncbi:MAG: hypothetical protein JOZ90_05190 [Alphaproteobacteria bacterium]|nr:hypothetical protein [Alphaproteobacteria bacterium]MBV9372829.1 hypothetical protein [Alphaproteobacteria bacterium]MBV9900476.1 hypothetical protein [Alphaproteobacteria bacterium]